MTYQRVMIIGSPGSGQSILPKSLSTNANLPLIHLDKLHWLNHKETVSEKVFLKRLTKEVVKESWLINGNYASSLELRLKRADCVIWLQVPRSICLYRIFKR